MRRWSFRGRRASPTARCWWPRWPTAAASCAARCTAMTRATWRRRSPTWASPWKATRHTRGFGSMAAAERSPHPRPICLSATPAPPCAFSRPRSHWDEAATASTACRACGSGRSRPCSPRLTTSARKRGAKPTPVVPRWSCRPPVCVAGRRGWRAISPPSTSAPFSWPRPTHVMESTSMFREIWSPNRTCP